MNSLAASCSLESQQLLEAALIASMAQAPLACGPSLEADPRDVAGERMVKKEHATKHANDADTGDKNKRRKRHKLVKKEKKRIKYSRIQEGGGAGFFPYSS